jgi:hypothetical protein
MKQEQLKVNIDLKNTQMVVTEDNNLVLTEGFVLRKISRFVTGGSEDGHVPIPCFYDVKSGKIFIDSLPKELRAEYEEFYKNSK